MDRHDRGVVDRLGDGGINQCFRCFFKGVRQEQTIQNNQHIDTVDGRNPAKLLIW